MNNKHLIITSIADASHPVLQHYARECVGHGYKFVLVGDKKSPAAFQLDGCDYFSVERQQQLDFSLLKNLPYGHYARKNLGYLIAISEGANIIVETDDDNLPKQAFWNERQRQQHAYLLQLGWHNIYSYFTDINIWPRGFALEKISVPARELGKKTEVDCPIQQGLADENPDVDAIYRLTGQLPIFFDRSLNIAMGHKSICPFNSQNTTWFADAFPLMYLPSYCSFRMTDIWRSFIAQRIAWTCNWAILFHDSTVIQSRNNHDLMIDFSDEIPGYCNNLQIMKTLSDLKLKQGKEYIPDNMQLCYRSLIELGVMQEQEMMLLNDWLSDIMAVTSRIG